MVSGADVTDFANVQAALAAASGAVDFNSQNLTSVGTIGCGTITTTGNVVLPANGVIGVTDGNPQIVFDNANNWLEITGDVGIGATTVAAKLHLALSGTVLPDLTSPMFVLQNNAETYYQARLHLIAGNIGYSIINLGDTDAQGAGQVLYNHTDDYMALYTNGGEKVHIDSAGKVGILVTPSAQLHVDQSSTTAGIPVLTLDQADVSEEMIEFISTIGEGNAIEAANGKTLTTTHFIKVTLPGPLTRYIPVGTIA